MGKGPPRDACRIVEGFVGCGPPAPLGHGSCLPSEMNRYACETLRAHPALEGLYRGFGKERFANEIC